MDPNKPKANITTIVLIVIAAVVVFFLITRTISQNISFGNELEEKYK